MESVASGKERGVFTERPDLFSQLPDQEARSSLVEHYLPLAHSLANRYVGRGQDADDLRQVAMLALLHAIDRYDPGLGSNFTSFAAPTILGELKRYFRDSAWSMKVPRRMKEIWGLSRRANEELSQELGRSPTVEEVAERVGCSPEEAAEAAALGTTFRTEALEGNEEDQLGPIDRIGVVDDLEIVDEWEALAPVLAGRPAREREILYLRFYRDLTQREIADLVGMSQMNVSRILSSSLARLRTLLDA